KQGHFHFHSLECTGRNPIVVELSLINPLYQLIKGLRYFSLLIYSTLSIPLESLYLPLRILPTCPFETPHCKDACFTLSKTSSRPSLYITLKGLNPLLGNSLLNTFLGLVFSVFGISLRCNIPRRSLPSFRQSSTSPLETPEFLANSLPES